MVSAPQQILARASELPLDVVDMRTRIAAAGITPDDPGLVQARTWNSIVYKRAGIDHLQADVELEAS